MEPQNKPNILIQKSSGEREHFLVSKLISSLKKAGADDELIQQIVDDIQAWMFDNVSTKEIYSKAFAKLRSLKNQPVASRYKLKEAIMELGPTGYPFEQFIGKVMERMGFDVKVGQVVDGKCVTHEVDVVATKDMVQCFVECKYGLSEDRHVSVKVPLYIRSRVNDIIDERKDNPAYTGFEFQGWLVTNTRFTSDATKYGTCSGLTLLSWNFPEGNALKDIIDKERIYPITVLHQLTKDEVQSLLEHDIVICQQLKSQPEVLKTLLGKEKYKSLMTELEKLIQ